MKVFVCNDHASHYPVGCASVIVADDPESARKMLDAELERQGLDNESRKCTIREIDLGNPHAEVLCNGDY